MNQPTVSVIIVVQNAEKYMEDAIQSVLRQSVLPKEIIVVDGESTDSTPKIAKSFSQLTYIKQSGTGLANARNTGINFAKGDLIAFLDGDDMWTKDKLKIQTALFINQPEIQYSYGRVMLFKEPGAELRNGYNESSFSEQQEGRTPGTLIVRSSFFWQVGKFKTEYKIACDFEWFTRVKDLEIPFVSETETLLLKRVHNSNLSNNAETNRKEIFNVVKKSLDFQRNAKNPKPE